MGEIADMMLDGTMCTCCGEFMFDGEDGPGYPIMCESCSREEQEPPRPKTRKARKNGSAI